MFNETAFRRHAQAAVTLADQLAKLAKLMKTEGGHLTNAGRALVLEADRQGLGTGEIAAMLEVNPAVVRYHLRQQNRTPARPAGRLPVQTALPLENTAHAA
jgi:DNA-directed RNA polymerase specialized sigma24 family protein